MKRKTRTVTVNGTPYVRWFHIGDGVELHFSPVNDKTAVITVVFPCEKTDGQEEIPQAYIGRFPEAITVKSNREEFRIKTIEPKMAGILLSCLTEHHPFESRKTVCYNGTKLLSEMGYTVTDVKTAFYW